MHEENTIHPLISAKTRIAKYADVRKLRGRHAKEILTIGRTELRLPQDLVIRKQQTTRFSMKSKNRECITTMQWLCKAWRRNGFKVIHASQNQLRRRREVFEHSYTQKEIRDPFIRIILWNLFKTMKDLLHIDPTQQALQNELYDDLQKELRQYCLSLDFKKVGGKKQRSVCCCFLRNVQDLLADGQTPCERRLNFTI